MNVLIVNFFFQRIFRINSACKWSVHFTSTVLSPEKILIGKNVAKSFAVSSTCYIQGFNGIEIGDNTIFSSGVGIISANHALKNLETHTITSPIKIGKNCWIGKNAIILPGVVLGDNCTVGAGAVVTKSFGNGSLIAGVPAVLIRV
jgi:acetyltransferase-like isoleucine patch superfamily enzyme